MQRSSSEHFEESPLLLNGLQPDNWFRLLRSKLPFQQARVTIAKQA